VKLHLEDGQTEDSIQDIIQEMDYSFDHPQIIEHEIVDIMDTQVVGSGENNYIDLYDMSSYPEED
tara:strand:+ start:487 stop:681 length:195 start_codon:yes stop_codon:yes gene_type:complete